MSWFGGSIHRTEPAYRHDPGSSDPRLRVLPGETEYIDWWERTIHRRMGSPRSVGDRSDALQWAWPIEQISGALEHANSKLFASILAGDWESAARPWSIYQGVKISHGGRMGMPSPPGSSGSGRGI